MSSTTEIKVNRAYCYEDIERINFPTIKVSEDWQAHLGLPQLGNSQILVYAERGHGKTSYLLQMAKMFCMNGQRVHYNTPEEGMKLSFKMALKRNNIKGVGGFNFQKENYEELSARLSRRKQPKIVFNDSVPYLFRGKREKHFFDLIKRFDDTTFIWVAGADGNAPLGAMAKNIIAYEADVVIRVKDFEAVVEKNRFEAYEPRVIWQEGYEQRQAILLKKG